MWKYILKRILLLVPILLLSSLIIFFLMSLTGDQAYAIGGENLTEVEYQILRDKLGLNDPFIIRYFRYMSHVVQGNLGENIYGQSVWERYTYALPYTIKLSVVAMIITSAIAIPFGVIAAVKQNTIVDYILSALAISGLSVPSFWLGLMLIVIFSLRLGWLPASGADQGIKSIILPAIVTAVMNAALVARMTRSSMLDSIRADHLRTARSKGVTESKVITKHALGNAIINIITSLSNQFSILIGGSVVIETVFAWPGVGSLVISAVKAKDVNTVTGCVILTTVFVAIVILLVDLIYAFVDPRIKAQYEGK